MKKEELEHRKKNLRILKTIMIVLDILFIPLLIIQIVTNNITYSSYVILLICNVITFTVKIKEN